MHSYPVMFRGANMKISYTFAKNINIHKSTHRPKNDSHGDKIVQSFTV